MKRRKIDQYQKILLLIILLYSVFVSIKNPAFLHIETVFDIIRTSSTTMIVAIGLLLVMISGGIDVSFMAVALFGSYATINLMIQSGINSLAFAFAGSMLIGLVLGLCNAVLISWLKLPPFIITLGYAESLPWDYDHLYQRQILRRRRAALLPARLWAGDDLPVRHGQRHGGADHVPGAGAAGGAGHLADPL